MSWDQFVFEYVVRGFLLFALLLDQVLDTTSGTEGLRVRPTRLSE